MQWDKRTKWACALAGIALYFSVALALKYSYVPPAAPQGEKIALRRPFSKFGNAGFTSNVPELGASSNSVDHLTKSRVIVYENDRPLGPPHSMHGDIAALGLGRFSHWGDVIAFSTSDNTDPNSNGRKYWAVDARNR